MNLFLQRVTPLVLVLLVAGCSGIDRSVAGVKNSVNNVISGSHTLDTAAIQRSAEEEGTPVQIPYAVIVHVADYLDQRKNGNPRLLGVNTQPVFDLDKGEILADQDVANLVATVFRNRFRMSGYHVLEGGNAADARLEVSGVIRELRLNVKDRDEIRIMIETTVKDAASGKVVWSGTVTEKDDRYAGVFGDTKAEIVDYLSKELQLVGKKTVDSVSSVLPAVQPIAQNQPRFITRPISGVKVDVAPVAAPVVPAAVVAAFPATPAAAVPAEPEYVPHASATAGLLVVTTIPPRAKVYLDGIYFGLTPLRSEMKPSVHKITVEMEGYKPATEQISIRKGENTELELKLKR